MLVVNCEARAKKLCYLHVGDSLTHSTDVFIWKNEGIHTLRKHTMLDRLRHLFTVLLII